MRQAAPYREDEVVLIVAGDHALAGAASVDRDALAGLPFVSLHRSSTVAAIRAELEAHGIDWKHLRVIMARARRAGRRGSPGRAPCGCQRVSSAGGPGICEQAAGWPAAAQVLGRAPQ
jgi:hypothetical protein